MAKRQTTAVAQKPGNLETYFEKAKRFLGLAEDVALWTDEAGPQIALRVIDDAQEVISFVIETGQKYQVSLESLETFIKAEATKKPAVKKGG